MDNQSTGSNSNRRPGDLDRSFGTEGSIQFNEGGNTTAIVSDGGGKLIFTLNLESRFVLTRYLRDGIEDDTFRYVLLNFRDRDDSTPTRVLLQEDEKILVIGSSYKADEQDQDKWQAAVVRIDTDGTIDNSFGWLGRAVLPGPNNRNGPSPLNYKHVDGCLQIDQKILICASYDAFEGDDKPLKKLNRLFCLRDNGVLDPDFGSGGFIDIQFHGYESRACDVQVQRDRKIIVAGSSYRLDGTPRTRTVARYMPTGELDPSFGSDGFTEIAVEEGPVQSLAPYPFQSDIVSRVLVQDDDKILVAGYADATDGQQSGLLVRLEANGRMDGSFNDGKPLLISYPSKETTIHSMTLQADGKILLVGRASASLVCERVDQNGQIEGFLSEQPEGQSSDVTVQVSGRVVVAGNSQGPKPHIWGFVGN
ncbi:hypothetical protein [Pseudomonas sp. Q11]|uniref:hypothetical protein n=1 Tax=Pseudomonas sp. Q11 TaxID=2968470 RepID=UPI0021087062|nr:hypothetical protein [Pseudomonas sp. Q11]MCQ6257570.1 hypothetical protein [Pseudomonas sp. Q11]